MNEHMSLTWVSILIPHLFFYDFKSVYQMSGRKWDEVGGMTE